jgi:hypothetical protein
MRLSLREKAIIYGTVLGDGYIQKTGEKNSRLRLEHSFKQKNYLLWKTRELSTLFLGRPKFLSRIHPISGKRYEYARHQSNSSPFLGKLRKVFYPNGRKAIPSDLGKFIRHPLSLAVWYMDDGYYSRKEDDKTAYLYLGKVTEREAKTVQKTLEENFSLKTSVVDKKLKGMALRFFAEDSRRLADLIKPYILSEFFYKLPDPVTTCPRRDRVR